MSVEKNIYLPHILKLLWDTEQLIDLFRIHVFQTGAQKMGILACTDKRAIVILENQPDHMIDFKRTLRIYSIRLTSIIDAELTEESIRISSKTHGLEIFFDHAEKNSEKMKQAHSLLAKRKAETRSLSDMWRRFLKKDE